MDVGAYEFLPCDIDGYGYMNFSDFAAFALAWGTKPGDAQWDAGCDRTIPADSRVDTRDLAVVSENWLISTLPPNPATQPNPANRSAVAPTISDSNVYLILDYLPGASAVEHTGYFSDDIDDVSNRVEDANLGSPPWPSGSATAFYVGFNHPDIPEFARVPLVRGKTYYWCVDEFDGFFTWAGEVWSFMVMPVEAWGPDPANGRAGVPAAPDLTLKWNLGDAQDPDYDISYDVYYGTDPDEVGTSLTPDANVETTSHTVADLGPDTTYYWRIDTKKTLIPPPATVQIITGNIWSFTTASAKGI